MSEKLFLATIITILVYLGAEAHWPVRPSIQLNSLSSRSENSISLPKLVQTQSFHIGP